MVLLSVAVGAVIVKEEGVEPVVAVMASGKVVAVMAAG